MQNKVWGIFFYSLKYVEPLSSPPPAGCSLMKSKGDI